MQEGVKRRKRKIENFLDGGSDDVTNHGDIESLGDGGFDSPCDREAHVNGAAANE